MDFEPFAFRINDRALPELAEGYKPEVRKPGRPSVEKFDPYKDISEPQHRAALEAAFALKEEYGYKELEDTLIKTYLAEGVRAESPECSGTYHHAAQQTDDSTGKRQEVFLQARLPLLTGYIENHFTLFPYPIYTTI